MATKVEEESDGHPMIEHSVIGASSPAADWKPAGGWEPLNLALFDYDTRSLVLYPGFRIDSIP